MAEFLDVMFAVAQRHRIQTALRCLAAHQPVETILCQHLRDRANPVGTFGVAWRSQMVEACRMRKKECCHAGNPGHCRRCCWPLLEAQLSWLRRVPKGPPDKLNSA